MSANDDPVALNEWYAVGCARHVTRARPRRTQLLGRDILVEREEDGLVSVHEIGTSDDRIRALPTEIRYDHIWSSLGTPAREIIDMPEAEEPGRRLISWGPVTVRASGPRLVENFLDMAHFPFVHTDILGAEPRTEVAQYDVELRRDEDEIWATNCVFHQPRAAVSAEGGIQTDYMYRVHHPFIAVLYKSCPMRPGIWDLITLYVQPRAEDLCDALGNVLVFDDRSSDVELLHFQQTIFLQDRGILENQVPTLLPLDPRSELPTRADASSIAYRRWLKEKGLRYGIHKETAA